MLSGEGSYVGKRWKTTIGLISKSNFSCEAHFLCTFLCRFFCTSTTWNFQKLLSYTFYGGNVVRVPVHFFSLPLVFTLYWWPPAFLILSPPLQNFHVVLPTKICLLCFLSLFIALFLVWTSLACRPLSYFSVFLLLYIPNLCTWQFI